MISALGWVPRGASKIKPLRYEVTREEVEELRRRAEGEGEEFDADAEEETENGNAAETNGRHKQLEQKTDDIELPAALRMDEYDDEEGGLGLIGNDELEEEEGDGEQEEEEEDEEMDEERRGGSGSDDGGLDGVDGGLLGTAVDGGGGDEFLDNEDDDQGSDAGDNLIQPTDAVLLVANTEEEEFSSLEVHVYDEQEGTFYVHHDVTLPSLPLCLAWMDVAPRAAEGGAASAGSFVAVGTFEPAIEIWNMDVLDPLEPSAVLGGVATGTAAAESDLAVAKAAAMALGQGTKPKKKKKKKKAAEEQLVSGSHESAVMSLDWNHNHRQALASGGADCTVKLWDVTSQSCSSTLTHHRDKVACVRWHPVEATVLATAAYDRQLALLDARGGGVRVIKLSADPESVAWDPHHPERLLAASEDGVVACWDARNVAAPLFRFTAHEGGVSGIALSPRAPGLLATCSEDKSVKLWDVSNASSTSPALQLASKSMAVGKLFAVHFCPESPFLLATGGSKGQVALWHCDELDAVRARFGDGGGGGTAAAASGTGTAAAALEAPAEPAEPAAEAAQMDVDERGANAAAAETAKRKKKKKAKSGARKESV